MKKRIQTNIVLGLESLCNVLDNVPAVWPNDGKLKFYRQGLWGCWPLRLAHKAFLLEQRWGLEGIWKND
jgi:hypothetical protein